MKVSSDKPEGKITRVINHFADLWHNIYERQKLEEQFIDAMEHQVRALLVHKILVINGFDAEGELLMTLDEERFERDYLDILFTYEQNPYAQVFNPENLQKLRNTFRSTVLQYIQGNFDRAIIAEIIGITEREHLFRMGLVMGKALAYGNVMVSLKILGSNLSSLKEESNYQDTLERLGGNHVKVKLSLEELLNIDEGEQEA